MYFYVSMDQTRYHVCALLIPIVLLCAVCILDRAFIHSEHAGPGAKRSDGLYDMEMQIVHQKKGSTHLEDLLTISIPFVAGEVAVCACLIMRVWCMCECSCCKPLTIHLQACSTLVAYVFLRLM